MATGSPEERFAIHDTEHISHSGDPISDGVQPTAGTVRVDVPAPNPPPRNENMAPPIIAASSWWVRFVDSVHRWSFIIGLIPFVAFSASGFWLLALTADYKNFLQRVNEKFLGGGVIVFSEFGLGASLALLYLLMLLVIWLLNVWSGWVRNKREQLRQPPPPQNQLPAASQQQQRQQQQPQPPQPRLGWLIRFVVAYSDVFYLPCKFLVSSTFLFATVGLGFDFNQPDAFIGMMLILGGAVSFLFCIRTMEDFGFIDGFEGIAILCSQHLGKETAMQMLAVSFIPGFLKCLLWDPF